MLTFNHLLMAGGVDPSKVCLLRHAPVLPSGAHLLDDWRSKPLDFEGWQSLQDAGNAARLNASFWASFIGTADGRTVFAGLYRIASVERLLADGIVPLTGLPFTGQTTDRYRAEPLEDFQSLVGRLLIDWGGGTGGKRAWIQRAANQAKPIVAILESQYEHRFPGYALFSRKLGELTTVPLSWAEKLENARGVYLLRCPSTGAQYVGSATGKGGFWHRWQDYCVTGSGGNNGLIGIDTWSFQVTILQVAGSAETAEDILALETVWKDKLGTREHGFNRN